MTSDPIPNDALDDRQGFVGTAGSGKTYGAGTCVERLLTQGARVLIPDPLGVWYGLRLLPNGKTPSPFNVVIFGGEHADLPINEHAGALIGETAAGMAESAIIDLSGFGTKASERRFMLAFLTALYRHANKEPVHLIFDEADMWAPQRILDKEGEAAKLLGMMETVVRRGRFKGFIPWLISQRPAVLSKNVLSQVDGLVAFKLTSSQDRKALGDWIEAQADKDEGRRILGSLPAMQQGQAVVWLPSRSILETVQFPTKRTFDSSRTPKRGEKKAKAVLAPLDLPALKDRLAEVEAETKANDPRELKKRIGVLEREAKATEKNQPQAPDPQAIELARGMGHAQGFDEGWDAALEAAQKIKDNLEPAIAGCSEAAAILDNALDRLAKAFVDGEIEAAPKPKPAQKHKPPILDERSKAAKRTLETIKIATPAPPVVAEDNNLTNPQRNLLRALAWWSAMGHDKPTRPQVAAVAGWKARGSNLRCRLGELSSKSLITYPSSGTVALTDAGQTVAPQPDVGRNLHDAIRAMLTNPQTLLFNALLEVGGGPFERASLADAVGWQPGGSNLRCRLGELSTMEIVTYPESSQVELSDWVLE